MSRKAIASRVSRRNSEIYRLYLLGYTNEEIASRFPKSKDSTESLSVATISRIVLETRKKTEESVKTLSAFEGIHQSIALSDYVLRECMEAWERSKQPKTRKSASQETGGGEKAGLKKKAGTVIDEQIGDRGYLELALRAQEDKRKLLGIDAPTVQRYIMTSNAAETEAATDELQKEKELTPGDLARIYREEIR
jgi:hypothetical protein